MRELVHYDPDIALLQVSRYRAVSSFIPDSFWLRFWQEVDRLSDHAPVLSLEYSYTYHIGYPDKPHGLLIAWKTAKFEKVAEKVGRLDELSPLPAQDPTAPTRQELALSRATRNVFLLVALKNKNSPGGIILGTIHCFWHPKHVYERVRQLAILFAEARRFKESNEEWKDWEVVLAGDFNTQPAEFAYSLLMHHPVTQPQIDDFYQARVVHQSVDKIYDPDYVSPPHVVEDVEGGADAIDPDKVIWKSREAREEDGLLTVEEFMRIFSWSEEEIRGSLGPTASTSTLSAIATSIPSAISTVISSLSSISIASQPIPKPTPPPVSAYGSISLQLPALEGRRYVDREPGVQSGNGWFTTEDPEVVKKRKMGTDDEKRSRGDGEPGYTNFTPLWRCTLDYIFLLPSNPPSNARFVSLLGLHTKAEMEPGLPRKGVEPSDHVAIAAILEM